MKKISVILVTVMITVMAAGCASMPVKQYAEVLPKTSSVHIEKARLCKLRETGLKISFEESIDNPSAEQLELVEAYGVSLKKELEKRGFTAMEDSSKERTVIIKTKIGEIPSKLITSGLGLVGVEIEVWDSNDKLLLSFQQAVNTHLWGSPAKKQISKFVAPRVAELLKEKFL